MDTAIIAALGAALALVIRDAITAFRESRKPLFTEAQREELNRLFVHKLSNYEMALIAKYGLVERFHRRAQDE